MGWDLTLYISGLVLGLAVPLAGIFFLLKFKNTYGYKYGIAFFAGCFIWMLCHYFELISLAPQYIIFWSKLKYLGITSVPVSFFMLSLYYSGYQKWITLRKIMLFSIIPVATLVMAFTNWSHRLMWSSMEVRSQSGISYLHLDYGVWFWIWALFAYSLFLTSFILLAKLLIEGQKVFRNLAVVMLITILVPLTFNSMDIFGIYPNPYLSSTPLALALGCAALLYGLVRFKVGDFVPISIEPDIDNNKDMVIAVDKKNRIFYTNKKANRSLSNTSLIGKDINSVLGCNLDLKSSRFEIIRDFKLEKTPNNLYSLNINPFLGVDKRIIGKVLIFSDITEQKMAEERYRSIFDNSLDGIFSLDMGGRYVQANQAMLDIFGCKSKGELPVIDLDDDFKTPNLTRKNFEIKLSRKDGKKIWLDISLWSVFDKNNIFFEGIARDISSKKKTEAKIRYLSFHDNLTNLYNRNFFEEELKRLDSQRLWPISIIIGDVNGLKLVNDTFGHRKGDQLLCSISNILKECFRREDILARWGGDEFIAILPKTSYRDSQKIIKRIKQKCSHKSRKQLTLSISLGSATKEEPNQNLNETIKEAEDRMYRHKLIENKSARSRIISSLEKTLEERDYETEEHMRRMKNFSRKMGQKLNLEENDLDELNLLATLHDIGKIALADHIIMKPGKLNPAEWEKIKKHPEIGYRIASQSPELSPIADSILSHHERWDGTGYPRGLMGNEIPLTSRIIAVLDSFDAMTNNRPYRKAISRQKAINEIKKCSGTQFDPRIVSAFLKVIEKKEASSFDHEERKPPSTGSIAPCM